MKRNDTRKHANFCGGAAGHVQDIHTLVVSCYSIDVNLEDREVYPEYVRLKCFVQMRHIEAAKGTKYINHSVLLFNWQPHTDGCETCKHFSMGGCYWGHRGLPFPLGGHLHELLGPSQSVCATSGRLSGAYKSIKE